MIPWLCVLHDGQYLQQKKIENQSLPQSDLPPSARVPNIPGKNPLQTTEKIDKNIDKNLDKDIELDSRKSPETFGDVSGKEGRITEPKKKDKRPKINLAFDTTVDGKGKGQGKGLAEKEDEGLDRGMCDNIYQENDDVMSEFYFILLCNLKVDHK